MMRRDLPIWTVVLGWLLLQSTIEFKRHFAETLGRSSLLIFIFGAIACALFGFGLAVGLRNLFSASYPRHAFAYLSLNLVAIAALYGIHISEYVVFSRLEQTARASSIIQILPTLINKSQTSTSEAKRRLMAQRAFQYCGTQIMYRADNGAEIQYVPDAADETTWRHVQITNRQANELREIAEGQLWQLPFIMTLNAGCFLLSFGTALWWFAFKDARQSEG